MSETEAAVVETQAEEPIVAEVISDAALAKLKAKKRTAARYMIGWRTLDALIARLELAEKRIAEE